MSGAEQVRAAIEAWKEADQAASAAEKLVAEASFLHSQGTGPAPTAELVGDARLLRSFARERLKTAMDLMKAATSSRGPKP
jgi:hypothetical protein